MDEYGGFLGLMSIEDILNHLSIEDLSLIESSNENQSKHEWVVPGDLSLSGFKRLTGIEINSELSTTIGGALIEHLEHVPEVNVQITINDILYEVLQASCQQVLKVKVTLPREDQEELPIE